MRWAFAWTLYLLGDLWCRVAVRRGLLDRYEWPYTVYDHLMCWSSDIQGPSANGPWGKVRP